MSGWYYARTVNGQQEAVGPYDDAAINSMFQTGMLQFNTMLYHPEHAPQWIRADSFIGSSPAPPPVALPVPSASRAQLPVAVTEKPTVDRPPLRLRETWPTWAIVLGLLGWLCSASSMSRSVPLLCYPSIALIGAGITANSMRKYAWRWTKLTGLLITIAAIYLWGRYDTYDESWSKDNVRYTDTYTRWGHQHIYRDLDAYETPVTAEKWSDRVWSAHGPIAGTGKFHGEWTYIDWRDFRTESKFYWYGEEISEGEWHLRK